MPNKLKFHHYTKHGAMVQCPIKNTGKTIRDRITMYKARYRNRLYTRHLVFAIVLALKERQG
jgi:hypothetical protein